MKFAFLLITVVFFQSCANQRPLTEEEREARANRFYLKSIIGRDK